VTQANIALRNLKKRYNKRSNFKVQEVHVVRQGNFTVVTLNGGIVGVTKRAKSDKPDGMTGFHIALNRALRYKLKIA